MIIALKVVMLVATATMWMIFIYVISNYVDYRMKRKGKVNKFADAVKATTYDFCKPILSTISSILPQKYADFAPLIAFLLLRIVIFVLSKMIAYLEVL